MGLTSLSTRQNALDQYNDNLNWQGDAAKAVLALEAVRWLIVNRTQTGSTNERNFSYESLLSEKKQLEEYVALHGTAVNRASFTQGRMLT